MTIRRGAAAFAAGLLSLATGQALACSATTPCINEILADPPANADSEREYLEFRFNPGAAFPANTYFVAVEGDFQDGRNQGSVDSIIDVSGLSFGANGFLVLLPAGNAFTVHPDAAVLTSTTPGFGGLPGGIWQGDEAGVSYERPSTSFFIVTTAVAPQLTDDIDADDDGAMDAAFVASWTILDSVGIADNPNQDRSYAAINFRTQDDGSPSTILIAEKPVYIGRYGDSFGSTEAAWVGSSNLSGSNPDFLLSATITVPNGLQSKPLDHIGTTNLWENFPPEINLDATATTAEDVPIVYSGNFSISEDSGDGEMVVTISVVNGTLTLAAIDGLTFTDGDGTDDATMTFSGNTASVNAALSGAAYVPPPEFSGQATLTLFVDDQGNTGIPFTILTDEETQTIDVVIDNDAPVLAVGGDVTYTGTPVVLAAAATLSDIDSPDFDTGNVTVTTLAGADPADQILVAAAGSGAGQIGVTGSDVTYEGTVIGSFAGGTGGAPFVVTLDADATIAAVQALLRQLVFTNTSATQPAIVQAVRNLAISVADGDDETVALPKNVLVDTIPPSIVSLVRFDPAGPMTTANVVTYRATLNEAVTGVDATDFSFATTGSLSGVSITGVAFVSDGVYDVTLAIGGGIGDLTLSVLDDDTIVDAFQLPLAAGLAGGADQTYTIDVAPFVVSVTRADANPTNATTVGFSVTFSEPVTGVDASDFALDAAAGVTANPLVAVSGAGAAYNVSVDTVAGNGTLGIDVLDDDSIIDASLIPLAGGFTGGEAYVIDNAVTVVDIDDGDADDVVAVGATLSYTVSFDGDLTDATVAADDFSITGAGGGAATIDSVVETDGVVAVSVTPTAAGTIALNVLAANGLSDPLGNTLLADVADDVAITVVAVNNAPSFTKGADQAVLEDAIAQSVPGWAANISDGDGGTQTLTFTTTSDNAALFAAAPAVDATTGDLTFTTAPNAFGTANVTVTLMDNGGTLEGGVDSFSDAFTVTVTGVNDAPAFTAVAVGSAEDAGAQSLVAATGIGAGPGETQTVAFTIVSNDNSELFSVQPALAADGTLTYTTAQDANGVANLSVTLADDGGTADGGDDTSDPQTIVVTIGERNDAPTVTIAADPPVLAPDAPAVTIPGFASFTVGPATATDELASQTIDDVTVTQTATTGGLTFSAAPAIATDGTLTYTVSPGVSGSATFAVVAFDSGPGGGPHDDSSEPATFTIVVDNGVNDAPTFTAGADETLSEDAGAQVVTGWATAIDDGDPGVTQVLTFDVQVSGSLAFATAPAIDAATGTLTYETAANANGTATVTVTLRDDGGVENGGDDTSDPQAFTITVDAVNDTPSFTLGGNQSAFSEAGAQTVAGFATNIANGGADEAAQVLTFAVTNDANALFSAQPAIASDGTLTYTPASGASGTANVSVTLGDDAGATSAAQAFTITITVGDPAPTVTAIARASANPADSSPVQYAVTFSEAVNGVDSSDFALVVTGTVTGHSIQSVNCVSASCTVTVAIAEGAGTLGLNLVDDDSIVDGASPPQPLGGTGAGNGDFTGEVYTIEIDGAGDTTPPAVLTVTRNSPSPSPGPTVAFTVTFSEDVTGFDANDLALTLTGNLVTPAIDSVTGSGATYTVVVSTGTGIGTIRLDVMDDDTVVDVAANALGGGGTGNGAFTTGEVYEIDTINGIPIFRDGFEDPPSI